MKLSKEELTLLMEEYETTHRVDEYVIDDWHVWPLLRLALCMDWFPIETSSAQPVQKRTLSDHFKCVGRIAVRLLCCLNYMRILRQSVYPMDKFDPIHNDKYDAKRDVVLLTLSDRRVLLNETLYEIYSDPFVEILKDMGVSTLVWEQGEPRWPRYSKSAWISCRLAAECNRIKPYPPGESPEWFADYRALSKQILDREVGWHEIKEQVDAVSVQSLAFEQWLRRVNPNLLLAVCWYSPLVMSATMAARRLGIKTVEIQHGSQDNVHFAYSRWMRSPQYGYEVVPHYFWCWGAHSAENIYYNNPAFTSHAKFLVGGNLWLSRWLLHDQSCSRQNVQVDTIPRTKTILVTLQLEIEEILFTAIKESPHSWKWLIRFHPARNRDERVHEEQIFRELLHPGVELDLDDNLLYDLLKESDVHITGYSTCTLEALALGVPTIIISNNGRASFKHLIDKGAVFSAESTDELLNCIRTVVFSSSARDESKKEFANDDNARSTLTYLLESERLLS